MTPEDEPHDNYRRDWSRSYLITIAASEWKAGNALSNQFIYARYNAELSARWVSEHGLDNVDAAKIAQLDSGEHINDLVSVGQALAKEETQS